MLGNNEEILGVNTVDVFAAMVRELPWEGLRDFIQANPQVLKRCTIGGHRLQKDYRGRFEKILLQEADKSDLRDNFHSSVFAQWYPVHAALHKALEDYFHSDEYKAHREANTLDEDTYVLTEEKFNQFFDVKDVPKWRILLCFSHLRFTREQADRILNDAQGNELLLQHLHDARTQAETTRGDRERLENENRQLRERLEQLTAEVTESREERKNLRTEVAGLAKKFEASQTDNRRLRESGDQKERDLAAARQEAERYVAQETTRLTRDLGRLTAELDEWRSKYEKQRVEARTFEKQYIDTQRALEAEKTAHEASRREIVRSHQFANALLAKIDWPEVGKQLRMTPQIKRKFNSLVKKLNYEDDRTLRLEGTLQEFWAKLQEEERSLVELVSQSDSLEVQSGDVEGFWRNLTDVFDDVYIGLEARAILLRMLQEIFYQTLDMKDLETMALPLAKSGDDEE